MDIKVTKEQYEILLHLVNLENWMVNAYRTEDFLDEYNRGGRAHLFPGSRPSVSGRRLISTRRKAAPFPR